MGNRQPFPFLRLQVVLPMRILRHKDRTIEMPDFFYQPRQHFLRFRRPEGAGNKIILHVNDDQGFHRSEPPFPYFLFQFQRISRSDKERDAEQPQGSKKIPRAAESPHLPRKALFFHYFLHGIIFSERLPQNAPHVCRTETLHLPCSPEKSSEGAEGFSCRIPALPLDFPAFFLLDF